MVVWQKAYRWQLIMAVNRAPCAYVLCVCVCCATSVHLISLKTAATAIWSWTDRWFEPVSGVILKKTVATGGQRGGEMEGEKASYRGYLASHHYLHWSCRSDYSRSCWRRQSRQCTTQKCDLWQCPAMVMGSGFSWLVRDCPSSWLCARQRNRVKCLWLVWHSCMCACVPHVPFLVTGCRAKSSLCKLSVYESAALNVCREGDKWQFLSSEY